MSFCKRSWFVRLKNGKRGNRILQVNGDRVLFDPNGVAFYDHADFLLCWFPIAEVSEIEVMSQVSGEGNGYIDIGVAPGAR